MGADASDFNQRLTLEEVERFVSFLPDEMIDQLCLGAVRDLTPEEPEYWLRRENDCRVCQALKSVQPMQGPANALYEWHSFVGASFEMLQAIAKAPKIGDDTETELQDELLNLFGTLAFSRCIVIYACARKERMSRDQKPATPVGGNSEWLKNAKLSSSIETRSVTTARWRRWRNLPMPTWRWWSRAIMLRSSSCAGPSRRNMRWRWSAHEV